MKSIVRRVLPKAVKSRLRKIYDTAEQAKRKQRHDNLKRKLNKGLSSPSASRTPPYKLFGGFDDEFWLWTNTVGYEEIPVLREILPSMPDEYTQLRFTGHAGTSAKEDGFRIYNFFKQIAEKHLGDISTCGNILDFGCGWGRVIRFFLKDVDPSKLWGADCLSDVLEICKETNKWCNFKLVDPMPPTTFADNMFDLIYSYSVFSHLSEEAHKKWLAEFSRILKPGGLLIATTREREFILYCDELRKTEDLPFYLVGSAAAFQDTEQCLADYDSGKFCYYPMGGGDILDSSFFGEACISKGYVLNHWTEYFTFVDYIADRNIETQNIRVVKK